MPSSPAELHRPRRRLAQRPGIVAGACVLDAALFVAVEATGVTDPVTVPTLPHLVPILAALCGALLVAAAPLVASRARPALGLVCGAAMAAGSLTVVPHTVLLVVVWVAGFVTGGAGPFALAPQWLMTAANLGTIVAAVLVGAWAVLDRRVSRHRCAGCGRIESEPRPVGTAALPWLAVLTIAGSLPYGLLKAGWALGWRGGLIGHRFDDVSFASPGFGDTVVLTAISVTVAVLMGRGVTGPWLRPILATVGVVGSLMLLPVAALGIVEMVRLALGQTAITDPEIAPWAFLVPYCSFVVWGVALTCLTLGYVRGTRVRCRRHHVPAFDPDTVSGPTP